MLHPRLKRTNKSVTGWSDQRLLLWYIRVTKARGHDKGANKARDLDIGVRIARRPSFILRIPGSCSMCCSQVLSIFRYETCPYLEAPICDVILSQVLGVNNFPI